MNGKRLLMNVVELQLNVLNNERLLERIESRHLIASYRQYGVLDHK